MLEEGGGQLMVMEHMRICNTVGMLVLKGVVLGKHILLYIDPQVHNRE